MPSVIEATGVVTLPPQGLLPASSRRELQAVESVPTVGYLPPLLAASSSAMVARARTFSCAFELPAETLDWLYSVMAPASTMTPMTIASDTSIRVKPD
ncbi:hypothetical protein D3C86_1690240 [compost metagenome]